MTNILFFLRKLKVGGVEIVTEYLANYFALQGHNIYIAYFSDCNDENLKLKFSKEVKLIPIKKSNSIFKIRKLILTEKIDLIVNQWGLQFYYSLFFKICNFGLNTKLVSVYHNKPSFNGIIEKALTNYKNKKNLKNKIHFLISKFMVSCSMKISYILSDRYILLSETYIQDFCSFTRTKNIKKLRVIQNPITCKFLEIKEKENILLYVGRLDETQKKVIRLLKVWEEICKEVDDWKFYIIGDGESRKKIDNFIKEHKLKNIVLTGYKEPESFYQKSKIICLTSEFEGFPLVLLEAMSYGIVPVVYNSFEVAEEIVKDNGLLIEKVNNEFNVKKFAAELKSLMLENFRIVELSAKAKEKSKQYSIENIYKKWQKLFSEVE